MGLLLSGFPDVESPTQRGPKAPLSDNGKLLLAVALAFAARVLIDVALSREGYLYGDDPDTFWRLGLSWRWAQEPFLAFGHWLPLQFWLVGATFRVLEPLRLTATPLVPVIWNHLFFGGSLAALYLLVRARSGETAAVASLVLASAMTTDVWVTYSGLAEPLVVLAGLVVTLSAAAYLDHSAPRPSRYLYFMAAAAAAAAATHYLGWYLAPFVLAFLAYVAIRGEHPSHGRAQAIAPIFLSAVIVLAIPLLWMLLNFLKSGDPLRFLATAQGYHQWFARQQFVSRLASNPKALWSAEPAILLAAAVSLPLVALTDRRALLSLLPATVYFALLSYSGLMSYVAPEMHPRYSLLIAWLLIPVIASAFAALVRSRSPVITLSACAGLLVVSGYGVVHSFTFSNWMDSTARLVAARVDAEMRTAGRPLRVLIEQQLCLFPTAGIANSVSRPDWTTSVDPDRITALRQVAGFPLPSFDLAILTSPLTADALAGSTRTIARLHDYTIVAPGGSSPAQPRSLPAPWVAIRQDQFLAVNQDGTIHFAFASPPASVMDKVGIRASIPTTPGTCYILGADLQDWLERPEPTWAVLQQLIVNDVVLWSHDVAGTGGCWQRLDHYLVATSTQLNVELAAVAPSGPLASTDWPSVSLTGIRNLRISECQ